MNKLVFELRILNVNTRFSDTFVENSRHFPDYFVIYIVKLWCELLTLHRDGFELLVLNPAIGGAQLSEPVSD